MTAKPALKIVASSAGRAKAAPTTRCCFGSARPNGEKDARKLAEANVAKLTDWLGVLSRTLSLMSDDIKRQELLRLVSGKSEAEFMVWDAELTEWLERGEILNLPQTFRMLCA